MNITLTEKINITPWLKKLTRFTGNMIFHTLYILSTTCYENYMTEQKLTSYTGNMTLSYIMCSVNYLLWQMTQSKENEQNPLYWQCDFPDTTRCCLALLTWKSHVKYTKHLHRLKCDFPDTTRCCLALLTWKSHVKYTKHLHRLKCDFPAVTEQE